MEVSSWKKTSLSLYIYIYIYTANGGVFELVMFDYRKRYFVGLKKSWENYWRNSWGFDQEKYGALNLKLHPRVHRIYQLSYPLACSDSIPF
jgi:hypothetical protein